MTDGAAATAAAVAARRAVLVLRERHGEKKKQKQRPFPLRHVYGYKRGPSTLVPVYVSCKTPAL